MPGPVREKPGQNGHTDTSWQMHQHPGVQGSCSPHMFSQLTAQPHPDNLHTVSTAGEWVAIKKGLSRLGGTVSSTFHPVPHKRAPAP